MTLVMETKAKLNYWDYPKIKTFAQGKKPSTKEKKKQVTAWRRYLQMIYFVKGLISKNT